MRKFRLTGFIALMLAAFTALGAFGCGMEQVSDALDLAGEIVSILADDSGETTSPGDDTVETTAQGEDITETTASSESLTETSPPVESPDETTAQINESGSYSSKEDVALYIHTYGRLPDNFITKSEARELGWSGGSLEAFAKGCAIGGDSFGNREGLLPSKKGRTYTECDIDTVGKSSRGAKRIVFSNDGLIYYTDDHYESFTLLYGEEN